LSTKAIWKLDQKYRKNRNKKDIRLNFDFKRSSLLANMNLLY